LADSVMLYPYLLLLGSIPKDQNEPTRPIAQESVLSYQCRAMLTLAVITVTLANFLGRYDERLI
jgi:hypothetical protein